MASLSVQDVLDANCCARYTREALEAIWDGEEGLSAEQMLDKVQVPLGDRVWAMMQAEPELDWSSAAAQLYAMVDAGQYPASEGEPNLAAKFGPDAWTAAHHLEAYAALIDDPTLVQQAEAIVRELLR